MGDLIRYINVYGDIFKAQLYINRHDSTDRVLTHENGYMITVESYPIPELVDPYCADWTVIFQLAKMDYTIKTMQRK